MTCSEISAELDEMNAKEAGLSHLHTRRQYRDNLQARFLQTGQGDGEEAGQIAVLRGKRKAAITALEQKRSLHSGL
ncbi:MAG: hypothetical protein LBJ59_05915 [Zoogloeaceae bacterium]|nr:hypothetical protein [Zoogloeaceae bacterium]